ncbi:MAG: glutathione peroxidase, partial [Sphingomonadaceae bacterium]|nr:glutathione peroxidase [Sphingomonadaceae bacterium]
DALVAAQPLATSGTGDFRAKLAGYGITPKSETDVLWNFEKFLVDRGGKVVARFAPDTAPEAPLLTDAIEAALG